MYFQLIFEAIKMAIKELFGNKLRTFLSLVGITIGIFCIISILAVISTFENQVKDSVNKLGNDVIFIRQFPWQFGEGFEWWEYIKRPKNNLEDYKTLKENLNMAQSVHFATNYSFKEVKFGKNIMKSVNSVMSSFELEDIFDLEFDFGRYFTEKESLKGEPVIIIGAKIAEELFNNIENAINKNLKADGRKYRIVGVLKKEGESILGSGFDESVIVPINNFKKYVSLSGLRTEPEINVKAKPKVSPELLKSEITSVLRKGRRLKPKQKDNFSLNQMSMISTFFDTIFGIIKVAGSIIGGFSILVGGFGIANIMFVSVRERTKIIGIKKALGATKLSLLLEFLVEAIILCIIGGLVGLLSVFILTKLAPILLDDFTFELNQQNILIGVFLSIFIGLISGFIPALRAANMNPVDAIRTT